MNFIDYFLGYWITKKSIFLHKSKKKYSYEEQIKIIKNDFFNENYIYKLAYNLYKQKNYSNTFYLNYKNNLFYKNTNTYKYKIEKMNNYLLKININLDNNLTYCEYIHLINKNFNTSVSFIKKNKNYLITMFTSYIRIRN